MRDLVKRPVTIREFDNHVCLEAVYRQASKFGSEDKPNEPYNGVFKDDNQFYTALKIAMKNIPSCEKPLALKTLKKWITPQGGSISKNTLIQGLLGYLEDIKYNESVIKDDLLTAEKLIQRWMPKVSLESCLTQSSVELWRSYRADHRSSQSSLGIGDRRDHGFVVKCISLASSKPFDMDPIIADGRFKDSKYRNIFNDPLSNYFREARCLSRMFDDWIAYEGDIHYSDMDLGVKIESCRAKAAYAGDYASMDKTLCLEVIKLALTSMIKAFSYDIKDTPEVLKMISNLLSAPLVVADEVWYAVWNWLSGIFPTHNVEGYINFTILANAALDCGFKVVMEPKRLRKDECFIFVCGDDSIVLFGSADDGLQQKFSKAHYDHATSFGLVLEMSKVEFSTEVISVCKKTYALNTSVRDFKHIKIGSDEVSVYKYPLGKALNALYHPEHMPVLPWDVDRLIWMTGILSCARGCQNFNSVLNYIIAISRDWLPGAVADWNTNHRLSDKYNEYRNQDWWLRELGNSDASNPALDYILTHI